MTPYYDDGLVTIYHGDALEILPELEPADLGLTDPPYNYGFEYGKHNDFLAVDAYVSWCRQWFELLRGKTDRAVVFPGHGNLPVWWEISKPAGFGCWFKPGNPARAAVMNFCEWEPWLYWGKFIGGSDVIRATVSKQSDTEDHPCPKPLSLFTTLIRRANASTVIDPFAGSGTTLKAAKSLGVKCVGIELEERFCATAARRCAQEVLPLEEVA